MNKIFFLITFLCFSISIKAHTNEKPYYIYNIVTFSGDLDNKGVKVMIDNGQTIERLRDKNGNKITFKTPAAVLMYFISKGWELYINGATTTGGTYNGTGHSSTTSYWIFKRPCSEEEFREVIEKGIKGKSSETKE